MKKVCIYEVRSPTLPEESGNHADHQVHRRPGGQQDPREIPGLWLSNQDPLPRPITATVTPEAQFPNPPPCSFLVKAYWDLLNSGESLKDK